MEDKIAIRYGEFYDYPRMIRFQFGGDWFFLDSSFDENKDDYPDFYDVYLLPFVAEETFQDSPCYWKDMRSRAVRLEGRGWHPREWSVDYWKHAGRPVYLGRIPIMGVGLDETRRLSIDARLMEQWLSTHGTPKWDSDS